MSLLPSQRRLRHVSNKTPAFISLAVLVLAGCSAFGAAAAEEPAYEVVDTDGAIQIRQYGELLLAQTEVTGNYDKIGRVAFRRLAGFIFGDNRTRESIAMTAPVLQEAGSENDQTSEKIAMTAPVLQEKTTGDSWVMSFIMPAKFTPETLPEPLDSSVRIATLPAQRVATIRFSGFMNREKFDRYSQILSEWIEANGHTALSKPRSAGYNPPWTLPPLRRNEIHIEIR